MNRSVKSITRQRHWDVQRAEQARWRFDDVRDRVDDTHGRGRHGGPARTVTFGFAERQLAVNVGIADDVDAVGRVALRTRPVGCDAEPVIWASAVSAPPRA